MTAIPFHYGQEFAGQTLAWMAPDTQENYERLCEEPHHRQYFASHGWDQPGAITYKFNSYGFRCEEFSGGPYLLALGCSYTMGYGLPLHETWPYKLGQSLGLKTANLAWGGYSADTCFRLAEYWIDRLRPQLVVMLSPPIDRFELHVDPKCNFSQHKPVEVIMTNTESYLFRPWESFLRHYFVNDTNSTINQTKNALALRQLCADMHTNCVVLHSQHFMQFSREEIGYARDYLHGGPRAHDRIQAAVLEQIKHRTNDIEKH